MLRLYQKPLGQHTVLEHCFNIDTSRPLRPRELELLRSLIGEIGARVSTRSRFGKHVFEKGPRLSIETPVSSNAVSAFESVGLPIRRFEVSTRYPEISGAQVLLDRMTEEIYRVPLTSFSSGKVPDQVRYIDLLARGEEALREVNVQLGLGMDAWDITYYTSLFLRLGRNPTDVELFHIGNANSEHSRHWFFRAILEIDGIDMPESLMEIVQAPWKANPGKNLVAFDDNAGVIRGGKTIVFQPIHPGRMSGFQMLERLLHITMTAETHNFPTMVEPLQGAITGGLGRMRDNDALGRGATIHVGGAGYCVGNLFIPGYEIPGEKVGGEKSLRVADALDILIRGSDGVSKAGNEYGEPCIGGFCRSFEQVVDGLHYGFRKPVLYSAGMGFVDEKNLRKREAEVGMLIVQIGGLVYPIGVGGGSASSVEGGSQSADLDFNAVQRGNPQSQNLGNRVLRSCDELGDKNPIEALHDQGAGGSANVLTELVEKLGGRVSLRKINVGDKTMSVLQIWVAEAQERYGLLVRPKNIRRLREICRREGVNCEVLGKVTGDNHIVVYDSETKTTPVNLPLLDVLAKLPRKRFSLKRVPRSLKPLTIDRVLSLAEMTQMVFQQLSVGSNRNLTNKVDRSVTGLVARQQCCGPLQLPIADCSVMADSYFRKTGAAKTYGEQPLKMLINPAAGARMGLAEWVTNISGAKIRSLNDVGLRANWMWAAKLPGQGAMLYDAALALRDMLIALGIATNGGKDSLSMSAKFGDELVISPGQLVISGCVRVPDVNKVVTPDLKPGGVSAVSLIDFGAGKNRLGGSALAQALGQLGNESPDIEDPELLLRAHKAVQELIRLGAIRAYHDRSDGGLITALSEMCMAGLCGARVHLPDNADAVSELFSEEAGMLIQYTVGDGWQVSEVLDKYRVPRHDMSIVACADWDSLEIRGDNRLLLDQPLTQLRAWWEATATAIELRQANPICVESEARSHADKPISYKLTFKPTAPNLRKPRTHKVAVIREKGTNGDREMTAALFTAGLDPFDVNMQDILDGKLESFDRFRGLAAPGGFSYADVLGSAKGWAAPILYNPRVHRMFERFYKRSDTFSLAVCNGFQLMTRLGWAPEVEDPRKRMQLLHNTSGRFESRSVGVKILESPAIHFKGMAGSVLPVWSAHGEGRRHFPDPRVADRIRKAHLVPLVYVGPEGEATEVYPYNPNGSPEGWAGLCSPNGHHLGMMPHPERCFLKWQWPWMPEKFRDLAASPWLQVFQNLEQWCSR